ncbi:MAG: hypothetical protein ACAI34_21105 [Verrucomicrobium sp.]|nr:hypothetical protein [Verrucomicrobium sp.]
MHPSVKAIVQLLVILAAIACSFAWLTPHVEGDASPWLFRTATTLLTLTLIALLVRNELRKDKAPDHLAKHGGQRLEVGGFTFVAGVIQQPHGLALCIAYQNRFKGEGVAQIYVRPTKELIGRVKMDPIGLQIPFGPAEYGVVEAPFPAPPSAADRTMRLDVAGVSHYTSGKQEEVRYREGLAVKAPTGDLWQTTLGVLSVITSLPGGAEPTRLKIKLPRFTEALPSGPFPSHQQVLWRLDDQGA